MEGSPTFMNVWVHSRRIGPGSHGPGVSTSPQVGSVSEMSPRTAWTLPAVTRESLVLGRQDFDGAARLRLVSMVLPL